jgi:hypothetical protein
MSEEIVYSNIQSKPCPDCSLCPAVSWGNWFIDTTGAEPICIRLGCTTACDPILCCHCMDGSGTDQMDFSTDLSLCS